MLLNAAQFFFKLIQNNFSVLEYGSSHYTLTNEARVIEAKIT